jgi:hypothetical protein
VTINHTVVRAVPTKHTRVLLSPFSSVCLEWWATTARTIVECVADWSALMTRVTRRLPRWFSVRWFIKSLANVESNTITEIETKF